MKRLLLLVLLIAAPGLAQDTKISALPNGSPGQATDAIPIACAGANYRLAGSDFLSTSVPLLTVPITFQVADVNGHMVILQTSNTADSTHGAFAMNLWDGPLFTSTRDPILNLGYNQSYSGTAVKAGEPQLYFQFEADYEPSGGNRYVEWHLNYWNAAGTLNIRPIQFTANRTTDVDILSFSGTSINFLAANGVDIRAQFDSAANFTMRSGSPILKNNNNQSFIKQRIVAGSAVDLLFLDGSDVLQVAPAGYHLRTNVNGSLSLEARTYAQVSATAPPDGTLAYCSDCLVQASCAGSGTGALAKRLNGAWVCN